MASRLETRRRRRWVPGRPGSRFLPCLVGVAVLVSACSTGAGGDKVSVQAPGGTAEIEGVSAAAVVSGKEPGGWLLARMDAKSAFALFRFSSEGLTLLADLPDWQQGADAIAFNGGVLVGGVRCGSSDCSDTTAELLTIDPGGAVKEFAIVDKHEGPPTDTDVVDIVGVSSAGLWVRDFEGRLTAFDDAGLSAAGPIQQFGEPCVIGSDLYLLQTDDAADLNNAPTGLAEDITAEGKGFEIRRWDGKQLGLVQGGRLEAAASPGPNGFCAGGGFEVPAATRVARWTPDASWRETAPTPEAPGAQTGIALSSSSRSYVVDSNGGLVELVNGRTTATSMRFSTVRGDRPPLGLLVDDANGQLVACLQDHDEKTGTDRVECEVQ